MHRTAIHDWHVARDGRMVDFAGWNMPIQYSSIIEEHQAVRQRVGLFDIGHMGRLKFTGPEAFDVLDRLLTNDVTKLEVGQVRYSLVCNEQGGTLDDVLVYRFDDCYRLVVNASNREKIVAWINRHLADADVEMTDETFETAMIAVQGPSAVIVLNPFVDVDIAVLGYYTAIEAKVNDVSAIVSRTGYTGEDGFEVVVDAVHGQPVWESLIAAGHKAGLLPCGLGCRDTLRLEAGMPLYGHEMDECIDPLTAGLGFGVKLRVGDFIGKTALTRIQQGPFARKRVGLRLEGRRIAREGAEVLQDEVPIGQVTSGTYSPTLGMPIAMAYLTLETANPGNTVEVDLRGQRVNAVVCDLPFYRRRDVR
ncbi:MAG: glycine cleavage system aminomethyltransferase GcvT [Planctomycetaceae bacterium]|nr:glycine cleavage system aminomethyltransferase GcvT [Planctomycetaceae bacterium]